MAVNGKIYFFLWPSNILETNTVPRINCISIRRENDQLSDITAGLHPSAFFHHDLSPPASPSHHPGIQARAGSQWELMVWQLNLRIPTGATVPALDSAAIRATEKSLQVLIAIFFSWPLAHGPQHQVLKLINWLSLRCGVYHFSSCGNFLAF